jgi:hypothetical protein
VLDSSQVQARVPNPEVPELGHVTWADVSIPQTAIPVTIKGHPYLVEVDEFATSDGPIPTAEPEADVGAARIIDIADERAPRVVSTMKLEVNLPAGRAAAADDPGTESPVGGYSAHYCAVPQREEPGIVACSFILSGLRIFDIRDPLHPKELAYYSAPPEVGAGFTPSNYAMSAPTFAPERGEVWYADTNTGFWAVRLTNGVWPFPAEAAAAAPAPQVLGRQATRPAPPPATSGSRLPSTGGHPVWLGAGVALLVLAAASGGLRRRTLDRFD